MCFHHILAFDTLIAYSTSLNLLVAYHVSAVTPRPSAVTPRLPDLPLALRLRSKEHTVALHPDVLTP